MFTHGQSFDAGCLSTKCFSQYTGSDWKLRQFRSYCRWLLGENNKNFSMKNIWSVKYITDNKMTFIHRKLNFKKSMVTEWTLQQQQKTQWGPPEEISYQLWALIFSNYMLNIMLKVTSCIKFKFFTWSSIFTFEFILSD